MRIVLADPPLGAVGAEKSIEYPNVGILYLISYLRRHVKGAEVYYLKSSSSCHDHVREVQRIDPDLYGISFTSAYEFSAYQAINAVRKANPSLPIICGGAHPTAAAEDVLRRTGADVCCLGEGEETFVDLVKTCTESNNLALVAGIAYKRDGNFTKNSLRPLIANLDDIPFPAWDCVDFAEFLGCRKYKGKPSTYIVASRGCPFNCNFCSSPVWKLQKPWVRKRNPQNIASEVNHLYSMGIREISIQSDEMNPDHDWCVSVFEGLASLGHTNLYFQCNLRAKPVTDRLAESLKKANCWVVHLGIESGNQRVLDGIKKQVSVDDIIEACRIFKRHGIKVFGFFMMYQAWEDKGEVLFETPREVNHSLLFLLKLRLRNLVHFIGWAFAAPLPGSELYSLASKHNLLVTPTPATEILDIHDISMKLPGVTRRQMQMSRAKGLLLQGLFVWTSREYYRRRSFWANLKHGFKRLKYAFNFH